MSLKQRRTWRARFIGHDEHGQALYVAPKQGPVQRRRDRYDRSCRARHEEKWLREFRQAHHERHR